MHKCNGILAAGSKLSSRAKISQATLFMTPVVIYIASLIKGVQAKENLDQWLHIEIEYELPDNTAILNTKPDLHNQILLNQEMLLAQPNAATIIDSQEFILLSQAINNYHTALANDMPTVYKFEQTDFALISEASYTHKAMNTQLWHDSKMDLEITQLFEDHALQTIANDNVDPAPVESGTSGLKIAMWSILAGAAVSTGIALGITKSDSDDNSSTPGSGTFSTITAEKVIATDDVTVGSGTLTLAKGKITDNSGGISFGDNNLSTTGMIRSKNITATDSLTIGDNSLTLSSSPTAGGSITDTSNKIDFDTTNLITTGTLKSGTQTVTGNVTATGAVTGGSITAGTGSATGIFQSNGDQDLTLQTGSSPTGSITITDGASGNIAINPNGSGEVDITNVDIDSGAIDGTTIGANSQSTGEFTIITARKIIATENIKIGTGTLTLADGSITDSSGALSFGNDHLNTTGVVTGGSLTDGTATLTGGALSGVTTVTATGLVTGGSLTDGTATLSSGALSGATTVTATGLISGGSLDIDDIVIDGATIGHTNDATLMTLSQDKLKVDGTLTVTGANGNIEVSGSSVISGYVQAGSIITNQINSVGADDTIVISPNGTGKVNIHKVDIDSGAIDGTAIGGSTPSTGAFTTTTATTITASTSVDITGSAGLILENDKTITNSTVDTVLINAKVAAGTGSAAGIFQSSGDQDLTLQTGSSPTGSITITDGASGNIAINPNGSGEVDITNVDIDSGAIDGTTIGANSQSTGEFTIITARKIIATENIKIGTGTLTLADGSITDSSGALSFGNDHLNTTGVVTGGSLTDGTATLTGGALSGVTTVTATGLVTGGSLTDGTATLSSGALSGATTVTATGLISGGSLDIDDIVIDGATIGHTNDATLMTLSQDKLKVDGTLTVTGANGNIEVSGSSVISGYVQAGSIITNQINSVGADDTIVISPNGTGKVNIHKVDIDSGAIDGTAIGGSTPSTGAFTTTTATTITASTSVDITGSAGLILENDKTITNSTVDTVLINAKVAAGTGSAAGIFQSSGDQDLTLQTGSSPTGSITITDGANGNIMITPNGSGEVDISKIDIDSGAIDGTPIGANTPSTGAFTTTTASTSVDITGSAGLILENDKTITNSTVDTVLINAKVAAGTGSAAGIFQSSGDQDLTLQTGNSTTGSITITDGANGNIMITPNGSGEVDISKIDIDSGAIDGTPIGANTPSTGAFTTTTASTSVDITGSAGLILENDKTITNSTVDTVLINAKVAAGTGSAAGIFQSSGDQDLTLQTGNSTTGSITIADGANGNITITPNGSGEVDISKIDINSGAIDGTPIGANSPSTGAFTTTTATTITASTSVDITGSAGLILENDKTITNSTVDTVLINAKVAAGTGSAAGIFQSSGDQDLTLQTGNSTTGSITIADGANGNITITPNGSGEVDISKIDINSGAIDGTPIGANSPSTGAFTTITATTIKASTSVDITGSAGLILENDKTITNSTVDTVLINAKVAAGTGSAAGIFQSSGDQDLTLQTGNSTTGSITIADGANGNITITPNGSGEVDISKIDINSGAIDGTPIGANSPSTGAFTTITATTIKASTSVDITGSAGLILENDKTITNSTVDTVLINAKVAAGTGSAAGIFQSSGDQDLTLQTGNSTTGSITIADGANGNITITPNGSGEVDISKIDINSGAIDGTPIGANSPSTGAFTTITATGAAGLILQNTQSITNVNSNEISINAKATKLTGSLEASGSLKVGGSSITLETPPLSLSPVKFTMHFSRPTPANKFIALQMPNESSFTGADSYHIVLPPDGPAVGEILKIDTITLLTGLVNLHWATDTRAAPSDQRVKTNIQDLTETVDPLSIINQLNPVTFEFDEIGLRAANGDQTGTQMGLIAQDVAAVLPSTVITYGTHTDNTTGTEIEDFLYLEQNELTTLNIAGIQALDEKIIALEEQINADFSVQAMLNLAMSQSELNTAENSIIAVGSFQTINDAIDLHTIVGGTNGDTLLLMSNTETDWTLFDMDTVNNNEANIKLSTDSHLFDSSGDSIELIFMTDTWYEKDYTDIQ